MMETIYDNNKTLYATIVFRYFCTKCKKYFLNENEYDECCCGKKGKFVNNEQKPFFLKLLIKNVLSFPSYIVECKNKHGIF